MGYAESFGVPEEVMKALNCIADALGISPVFKKYKNVPIYEQLYTLLVEIEIAVCISNKYTQSYPMILPGAFAEPEKTRDRILILFYWILNLAETGEQRAYPEVLQLLLDTICSNFPSCEILCRWIEVDPNDHIDIVSMCVIEYESWMDEDAFMYKDTGVDHFTDFNHIIKTHCQEIDLNAYFFVWGLSNTSEKDVKWHVDNEVPGIWVTYIRTAVDCVKLRLFATGIGGIVDSDETLCWVHPSVPEEIEVCIEYWLVIERNGSKVICTIYKDENLTTVVDSLQITIPDWNLFPVWKFRFIYIATTYNDGTAKKGKGRNGPLSPV